MGEGPIEMWAVLVDDGLGSGTRPHELSLAHTSSEALSRVRKAVPRAHVGLPVRVMVAIKLKEVR